MDSISFLKGLCYLDILVLRNHKSKKLEIIYFVLDDFIHFCWDIGQDLAVFAVRSNLYQLFQRKL